MQPSRFIGLLGMTLLIMSCSDNENPAQPIQLSATPIDEVALRAVNSCENLQQRFIDNWVENLIANQRYQPFQIFASPPFEAAAGDIPLAGVQAGTADALPDIVSQTNLQEAGVDESDSVKADSRGNLYVAQHDKLVIADAFPADALSTVSTLDLGGYVSGIYLAETDNLVAALVTPRFEPNSLPPVSDNLALYIPWRAKTDLVLVDVSDVTNPTIQRRIRVDGNLVSSRRVDSRILLVQSYFLSPLLHLIDDTLRDLLQRFHQASLDGDEALMAALQTDIRQQVEDRLSLDDIQLLLPAWRELVNGTPGNGGQLQCEDVFAPSIRLNNNQLLIVTSIDLAGDSIRRVGAIGSGWTTYASRDDLFIVQSGNHWWWRQDQQQQSAIHHFSIASTDPVYVSTGLVKGFVNNSFSLSYHQDHLRVATTENLWSLSDRSDLRSTNHLFVLADNADRGMDIVGAVENYADNERIFSARFLGDKGFVVTFRRIDPLFTFDLSDPARPLLLGELEIPGFSNYMHPIDDGHLLTIGRDGNAAGATNQVAVRLFDVSDLANPLLLDSYTPQLGDGYSWSEANWDHHAFTYYAAEKLLSIPLASFDPSSNDDFMGLLVLNVDTLSGLSLAGTVDHEDLLPAADCGNNANAVCQRFYYRWLSQPTRSVFMTENDQSYLYSLSNIGIKAVSTSALDVTLGSLLLPSPRIFYEVYF